MANLSSPGLFLLAGLAGALIFTRVRFPAPDMNGPIVFAALLMLAGLPPPQIPSFLRLVPMILLGAALGQRVDRQTLHQLRKMAIPALLVAGWAAAAAFGIGLLIGAMLGIDYPTAVLSACPAGIAEVGILAVSFDAQVPIVVLFQVFRVFVLIVAVPLMVSFLSRRFGGGPAPAAVSSGPVLPAARAGFLATVPCLLTGVAGALVATRLSVPAAGVVGPFGLIAACQLIGIKLAPPTEPTKSAAKVGLGLLVGMTLTREVLAGVGQLLLPAVLMTVILVVTGLSLGFLVRRLTGWDLAGSLLCCAPVGLVQMAIVAESMDTDPVRVGLLSLVRLTAILVLVPPVLALISR